MNMIAAHAPSDRPARPPLPPAGEGGGEGVRALRTDRLVLRPLAARDIEPFVAYRLSERSRLAYSAPTRHDALKCFAEMVGHWTVHGFGRYAIALDDTSPAIGHAGPLAADIGSAPEMTWTLWDTVHEGRGYATEAARAILAHDLDRYGWSGIDALIRPENAGSIAVAQRLGFVPDPTAVARPWMPGALIYRLERTA